MDIEKAEEFKIEDKKSYLVMYKIVYADSEIEPFWAAWVGVCDSVADVEHNLEMCKDQETRVLEFSSDIFT